MDRLRLHRTTLLTRAAGALANRGTAVVITLIGLLLRVGYLLLLANRGLMSDAASYNNMAARLAQGEHFIPFWPPGLPLYLAGMQHLLGTSGLAARVSMLPFYLGLSLFLYSLAKVLSGHAAAGSIALLPLAFAPEMICSSVETTTELPTAMFLTLAALCLFGAETPRRTRAQIVSTAIILGLALGSLALLRPASLILLLAAPVYLFWRTRSLWQAIVPAILGVAMVFAWVADVHSKTGRFVLINTANAENLYLGNNVNTPMYRTWWLGSHHLLENAALPSAPTPQTDPLALNVEYAHVAKTYIAQHPALFLLRSFNRVCVFFAFNTYTGAYLIETYDFPRLFGLAVIAIDASIYIALGMGALLYLLTSTKAPNRTMDAPLLVGLCLLYASPYFVAFSHPRYHAPVEPLMIAASAAVFFRFFGADRIEVWKLLRRRRLLAATAISLFLLIQGEFLVIVGHARG